MVWAGKGPKAHPTGRDISPIPGCSSRTLDTPRAPTAPLANLNLLSLISLSVHLLCRTRMDLLLPNKCDMKYSVSLENKFITFHTQQCRG